MSRMGALAAKPKCLCSFHDLTLLKGSHCAVNRKKEAEERVPKGFTGEQLQTVMLHFNY